MSQAELSPIPTRCEPLPDNIRSIQPGGGICSSVEQAWGRVRRWCLRRLRPGYVRQMAELRRGDERGAPHEILDPRDLKFCRNQCDVHWAPEHDRFQWRSCLPFARWALAELQLIGWPLAIATVGLACLAYPWKLIAIVPAILLALVVYFFRDPPREIPKGQGLVVAPADGRIVELSRVALDPFVGGPALRIGIFLSIFNVHINRAPLQSRVIRLEYRPGAFLNALDPQSAVRNEAMWIGLEEVTLPHRRFVVRQISGMIARRIVCALRPGEVIERGEKFGMIKFGSRTELILPAEGFTPQVSLGDKVRAGSHILGRWDSRQCSKEGA